jgi:hypothetical protein
LAHLASAKKIPDAVCRREGAGPPPTAEGHKGPPYENANMGIFIRRGETRFMTTWRFNYLAVQLLHCLG